MGTGGSTGGSGGTGGASTPQTSNGGAGGSSSGGTGGASGSGGAATPMAGSGGNQSPPSDASSSPVTDAPVETSAPPATATCSVTPAANAAAVKLSFRNIPLTGLPGGGAGKSPTGITELRFLPHAPDEFIISQKAGALSWWRLDSAANKATLLRSYNVAGVYAEEDCGFISFALDPGFKDNKVLYAGYCTAANRSKVSRFVLTDSALTAGVDVITFSEPDSRNAWHAVGTMGFDPAGNMWMLHGELTDATNSQNQASNLGKLLRFRPRPGGGLDPAPGNPYMGDASKSPLVYAYGFRSPWRGYLDDKGRFLVGDVGDIQSEELNLVTAPGQNFGWNGTRAGPCSNCPGIVNPLRTYRVSSDPYLGQGNEAWEARVGRAIWVGVQYRDCGTDRYGGGLTGVYLFGDMYSGWVRGAVIDDAGRMVKDALLANFTALTSFAQNADGYIYATKFGRYGTGGLANEAQGLFRLEPAP